MNEAPREDRAPPEQMVWFPVLPAISRDEASPSSPSSDTQDGAVPQRRKSTFPGQANMLQEAQQRYWSQQLKHDSHLSQLKQQYEERMMSNQSQELPGGPKRHRASPEQRAQEDNDEAVGSRELFFVAAIPQGDPATGMLVLPSFDFSHLEARADFWGTSRGESEARDFSDDPDLHPVRIVPLESHVPEGDPVPRSNGTIYPGSHSISRQNQADTSSHSPPPPPPPPDAIGHGPSPSQPPPPPAETFTRPYEHIPLVNPGLMPGTAGSRSGAPFDDRMMPMASSVALSDSASRTHTISLEEATWSQGPTAMQTIGFTPTLNGIGNSQGEGELSGARAKPRAIGSSQGIPLNATPNTGVDARPERPAPTKSKRKTIITDFCCIFDGALPEIDTDQEEVLESVLSEVDPSTILVAWSRIRPTMTDFYPYAKAVANQLNSLATVRGMYFSPQNGGVLRTFVILEDNQAISTILRKKQLRVVADNDELEVELRSFQSFQASLRDA